MESEDLARSASIGASSHSTLRLDLGGAGENGALLQLGSLNAEHKWHSSAQGCILNTDCLCSVVEVA